MERGIPPNRRLSAEEKPSAILAAALELFAERGFHATNVPLIAERAGVSVGTLYHYFAHKEAIANEVYRRVRKEMQQAVYHDLPAGEAPSEQFRVLWHRYVSFAMARPLAFRFLKLHHHGSYLDEASRALDRQIMAGTHETMELGRLSGVLKPIHDEVLTAFVDGAIQHLIRAAQEGWIALTSEVVDQAAACCWQAIKEGWITVNKFTLPGETGRISLSFEYVQCGAEGCDCRGTASIASWGFQAQGKVWFTAADVARFYNELDTCYKALDGVAAFTTHEGNLKLEVVFGRRGQVHMQGTFQETRNEGNELQFRIQTDQSYIANALEELAELVKRYGAAV
ncbi:MAG TPA: TetR/AcrR family transcriptional regulator [Symbiobacteriaceae bacterium]|nr:TetR/AcrR family transcriptional regulator [Symbiobacteriaceae bacterium]